MPHIDKFAEFVCDVKIPLSGNKQKAQLFPTLKLLS